jgi:hypothetical protein
MKPEILGLHFLFKVKVPGNNLKVSLLVGAGL